LAWTATERLRVGRRDLAGIRHEAACHLEETMAERVFTEGPDGRVRASLPTNDGPKSLARDAHGEAADFLREDARAAAAQVHFAQARARIAARVQPARKTG
jgi:hypothetical protein